MFKRVLPVLAFALLASTASVAAGVNEQAGAWTIGPINTGGDQKFCSMKNTFDGGHGLVFARDASGVNSIGIDFGKKELKAGKQYRVTLDLPPMLTREMTAVAATSQVLLVNMGKDKAFYKSLAEMEALYLTALGRDHGYSLSGSGEALRELQECAASLKTGKPFVANTLPVTEDDELRKLRAENKILRRQSEAMKEEAIAATVGKDDIETARQTAAQLAQRQKQMEAENAALKQSLAEMQAVLQKQVEQVRSEQQQKQQAADAESARLREELAAMQDKLAKQPEPAPVPVADTAAEDALRAENEKLKQALVVKEQQAVEVKFGEPAEAKAEEPAPAVKAEVVPVPRKRPKAAAPARMAAAKKKEADRLEDSLAKILGASGVAGEGGLAARDNGDARTYEWQSDSLYGSAETAPVSGGDFTARVAAWFGRMADRCAGDFANTAQEPRKTGFVTTQKAEMACIDDENNAAAALLFVDDGKNFTVVMQEGSTEQMAAAVEKRNAVAEAVSK